MLLKNDNKAKAIMGRAQVALGLLALAAFFDNISINTSRR